MAFVPAFTVGQNVEAPSVVVVADTSVGTDVNITTRRVYLLTATGSYLVPTGTITSYVNWPTPAATIDIDVLNTDYSLKITVEWCDVGGNVLYTSYNLFCFTLYSEQFYYSLTQLQSTGGANIQDTNYFNNKQQLRVFIDSAKNAVAYANDIYGSQEQLDSAAYMITNQNLYF